MAEHSKIEWTDASWTPIRARNLANRKIGWHCEHATTGCEFCYAEGMNKRLGTGLPFKPGHRKDIEIFLDEEMLLAPLRWRRPRMIFVCSMTDLFADFIKDEWIDRVFAVMALCPQHSFQVLTKRAERMSVYMNADPRDQVSAQMWKISNRRTDHIHGGWPLRQCWLGVSAERQQEADERIPYLLETPAAVRFVSLEPLLGPVDLLESDPKAFGTLRIRIPKRKLDIHPPITEDATIGHAVTALGGSITNEDNGLNWCIVGGESGPSARVCDVAWIRSIVDQCRPADVPCFVKQSGTRCRMSREDAVQAVALGAGWNADGPRAEFGVVKFVNRKGEDPIEWPPDLRVRQWPEART